MLFGLPTEINLPKTSVVLQIQEPLSRLAVAPVQVGALVVLKKRSDDLENVFKLLTMHLMMHKVAGVGKSNKLTIPPDRCHLLGFLQRNARSFRVTRQKKDGALDSFNRCSPGRGRRNRRDKVE